MDIDLENKIIKSFINKEFQLRLSYEANNKREDFISKIGNIKYFKTICIINETKKNPSFLIIQQFMKKYDAANKFYVISNYVKLDGIYIDLETAVNEFSLNGPASLIIGLPSGFTHYKGDSYASNQPNFYLVPQIRFDGKTWNEDI